MKPLTFFTLSAEPAARGTVRVSVVFSALAGWTTWVWAASGAQRRTAATAAAKGWVRDMEASCDVRDRDQ